MILTFSPMMLDAIAKNIYERASQLSNPDEFVVDQIAIVADKADEDKADYVSQQVAEYYLS